MKDRDAHAALLHARKQLEQRSSLLLLTDSRIAPPDPLGEAVIKSMEGCRYEKKIILPGETLSYSAAEMIKVLDRLLISLRAAAGTDLSGTRYLEQMAARMADLRRTSTG